MPLPFFYYSMDLVITWTSWTEQLKSLYYSNLRRSTPWPTSLAGGRKAPPLGRSGVLASRFPADLPRQCSRKNPLPPDSQERMGRGDPNLLPPGGVVPDFPERTGGFFRPEERGVEDHVAVGEVGGW